MKLEIHATIGKHCVEFLRRKLERFDTRTLEYIRLYDRTGKTATQGTWGCCTYPSRKKKLGYRIRCSVSITPREFPYKVKWAIGTKQLDPKHWEWIWREDEFHSKEEAFVWIAGHEAFHWLRHGRQIPGQNYETQANQYGFSWLDEWRSVSIEAVKETSNALMDTNVRNRADCPKDDCLSIFPTLRAAVHSQIQKGVEVR